MIRLRPLMVGAGGAILGLLLLPMAGLVNFDASSGHWAPTDWFFHMSARQSTTLRSVGIEPPPLDDPDSVRRGAGHYQMVCAQCHGSPAGPSEQFARDLTPVPPPLVEQMKHWRPDARIFWNVKHGIKHTAMPAWPSQVRDDEVWDMVAFLQVMPKLDQSGYAELAGLSAPSRCIACHGEDGQGHGAAFPRLDLQSPEYLASALQAFRRGERQSGTMMAAARDLSDEQIAELANYFGKLSTPPRQALEGRGAEIARNGLPARDVPACDSCHGGAARPEYPRLAGQHSAYILRQLELFKALGAERGGKNAHIMAEVVRWLEPEDMQALADYYSGETGMTEAVQAGPMER